MRYIVAPTTDYCLSHSGMHKYIDRIKTASGKWRYIYSRAAEKTKKGVSNIANAVGRAMRKDKTTNQGAGGDNQYTPENVSKRNKVRSLNSREKTNIAGTSYSPTENSSKLRVRSQYSPTENRSNRTTNKGNSNNQYTPSYLNTSTKKSQKSNVHNAVADYEKKRKKKQEAISNNRPTARKKNVTSGTVTVNKKKRTKRSVNSNSTR